MENENKIPPSQEDLKRYEKLEEKVLKYVEKETGLKKKKDSKTVMIDSYILEDGKVHIKLKIESFIRNLLKQHKWDILISLYYVAMMVFNYYYCLDILNSIYFVDYEYVKINALISSFCIVSPVLVWLVSTNTDFWNFYDRKIPLLILSGILTLPHVFTMLYEPFFMHFVPRIASMTPKDNFTPTHIVSLARLTTAVPAIILSLIAAYVVMKGLKREENILQIKRFKLKHHVDLTPDNPYAYNIVLGKDLKTGRKIKIFEKDRWLHMNILGATGSGKTSSVIIKLLVQDLITKIRNRDEMKRVALEFLKSGKAYVTQMFDDDTFNTEYIVPLDSHAKEYEKAMSKLNDCGITVMAPDDSLTDMFYNLSTGKGEKCNRIDAKLNPDGTEKEGSIGYSPLYISPITPAWEIKKVVIKNATLTADVMQIIYEMDGSSDPYFASINRIATTTIAILLQITYSHMPGNKGKQAKLSDVQSLINNFDRIREYAEILERIDIKGEYQVILDTINNDFLGAGRVKFEDHCKGLRVQLNNFLIDPNIQRVMCAEKSIDLDKILRDGELTVVNIELGDLGPVNSPAFGLFFTISFVNAVLRRPGTEFTRKYHQCVIDEFPIVVSPSLEVTFTLFRKFRCAMHIAIQSFSQMHKNPYLKYLQGIILNSCAHHVVFGRTNPDDGKIYSDLSGKMRRVTKMETTSYTSMMNDEPSLSMGDRYQVTEEEVLDPSDTRYLDFQEITYFTVQRGRALSPRFGKVYFLTDQEKEPVPRFRVDWGKLISDMGLLKEGTDEVVKEEMNGPLKEAAATSENISPAEAMPFASVFTSLASKTTVSEQGETKVKRAPMIPLDTEMTFASATTIHLEKKKEDVNPQPTESVVNTEVEESVNKNTSESAGKIISSTAVNESGSAKKVLLPLDLE